MISIILPTYNEAGNIKALIAGIHLALSRFSHEIIVVDDDSSDKTWKIAEKLKAKVIRRIKVRGLTSAIEGGIKEARGEIIGWLDADLSHPPQLLKTMAGKMNTADAIVASRYVAGGADLRKLPIQVFLSRIINSLARLLISRELTDYTSGYILVRKKYLSKIKLRGDHGEYFIKLMADLLRMGAKVREVPYENVNRLHGQSKTAPNFLSLLTRGIKYLQAVFAPVI